MRIQHHSQPVEIDKLQRKIRQLDSQLYGLEKLNDEDSKARIVVVSMNVLSFSCTKNVNQFLFKNICICDMNKWIKISYYNDQTVLY